MLIKSHQVIELADYYYILTIVITIVYNNPMKKVSKSVLKAKMFEYFDAVEESGEPLVVTDFNRPVLTIIPYREKKSIDEVFKDLRGNTSLPRKAVLASTEDEWPER